MATSIFADGGGGTPGGSDTQVQFNDSDTFGGDAGLTYDKVTNALTTGVVAASSPEVSAEVTTSFGDPNAELTFIAPDGWGVRGNAILAQLVDDGPNTPLSVEVIGTAVVVHLETNGGGDILSTADEVAAAIAGTPAANALFSLINFSGDGTGIVETVDAQLSGGLSALVAVGPSSLDDGAIYSDGDGGFTADLFVAPIARFTDLGEPARTVLGNIHFDSSGSLSLYGRSPASGDGGHFELFAGDGAVGGDGGDVSLYIGSGDGAGVDGAFYFYTTAGGDPLLEIESDGAITAIDGARLRSDAVTAHSMGLAVYDVNGAAYRDFLVWTNGDAPAVVMSIPTTGTLAITATSCKATLQTTANATTGLVAGVLAASTNASIVITDGSGQVYRVPCII